MGIPKIIRKTGPFKHKYGIKLSPLKPYQQKIILNNPLSEEGFKTDDQFVQILFKIADMEQSHKNKRKFYHNSYTNTVTSYEEILEQSQLVDWKCAICNSDMISKIAEFGIENFVCKKCEDSHNSDNGRIDPRIVDSSFEFHKYCRKQLIKEQKKFLLYVKYFETGYRRGRL